jgi:DNA-binding GntR family transcriptional regulator
MAVENWNSPIPRHPGEVPQPRGVASRPEPVALAGDTTAQAGDTTALAGDTAQQAAHGVLADRLAAALVQREPGWRLPRRSSLARRYSVSIAEIDSAIGELVRRSVIRRLPDGQLYRASPAEYRIPVEGIGGLSTWLDPMGGEITRQAGHVSQRTAPQDVAAALGLKQGSPLRAVQCVWAVGDEPVAISTAYVPETVAHSLVSNDLDGFRATLSRIPPGRPGAAPAQATAVDLELSPAQPWVARSLRLAPGQSTISVTIRFDDPETGMPAGLTVLTMKPDRFRVVIEGGGPLPVAGPTGPLEDSQAGQAPAEPVPTAWRW